VNINDDYKKGYLPGATSEPAARQRIRNKYMTGQALHINGGKIIN